MKLSDEDLLRDHQMFYYCEGCGTARVFCRGRQFEWLFCHGTCVPEEQIHYSEEIRQNRQAKEKDDHTDS